MRVLFAGTPEIAVPSLEQLSEQADVVGALTAPDAPSGRRRTPQPSAVKRCAERLGIPVLQPERLNAAAREAVARLNPQLLVCVAYGRIFGPRFLGLFSYGGINLHPSLLPRHRGPAPIPAAILAGDSETGITIQTLALEMDAGDILRQARIALDGTETTGGLTDRLAVEGAPLLGEVVRDIAAGAVAAQPQDHRRATYCRLITAGDGTIDWNEPARMIERMVRAYNPWPGAHTWLDGRRLTIHESSILQPAQPAGDEVPAGDEAQMDGDESAGGGWTLGGEQDGTGRPGLVTAVDKRRGILVQTGDGLLAIRRLQLQSRTAMDWKSFANGYRDVVGTVLGGTPPT